MSVARLASPLRRFFLPLAATLLLPTAVSRADDPPTPTFANVTVHDPSIMRAPDGTFYIYGSHLASASSPDLVNWTQLSTSPAVGNALVPNPAVTFAEVLTWAQATTFWAPDMVRLADGRYYFYYDACRGDAPLSALGVAVSDSPTGPFAHVAVLLKSGMSGASEDGTTYNAAIHPNVVDPAVFFDEAGKLWMVYGSYSGGIFILELDPATGRPRAGQGYGKHLIGRNHSRIEGAYMLYSPESDYYYLFMSFGGLAADGGYNMRVARSRQPDGPFLDAAGHDLSMVGGANGTIFDDAAIAPYGVKLMGNYQFATATGETGQSRGYVSPGHNSAYYDPAADRYFLVFHTRFVGRGEQHEVRVHQFWINDRGWPVVGPQRYARETITATDAGRVVGDYKLINHGKDITAAVKTSTVVALQPDGTISGAASGTWQLIGDYDAILTLDGTAYHGVFVRQWDDDRARWLNTFTVQSEQGVSVWGSKVAVNTVPVILTPPVTQSASVGGTVTFTAVASGEPLPSYQWRKDGVAIAGATTASLGLTHLSVADAAHYTVVATNAAGSATSAVATLSVTVPPITITAHPASLTQPAGTVAILSVTAASTEALTYQWTKNGAVLAGRTAPTLTFAALQPGDAGDYCVQVIAPSGTTTSRLARLVVAAPDPGRISNVSIRSVAGRDGAPLIIGLVMGGGSKNVLLRAVGPTLATDYGVAGTLADPVMSLHVKVDGADTITGTNDNWGDNNQATPLAALFQTLGAFPLPNPLSRDAALATPITGPITVHVNSVTPGASGVVIVECYDAAVGLTPRLLNISARNYAGVGDETLIAGFVIDGNTPKRVLIRGVGPTLNADFGIPDVLPDPRLEIHTRIDGQDTVVATNDDWGTETGVAAASTTAGAFALAAGSADAAVVVTLPAGAYTAHVSGAGAGATGDAIVEVYELP